jgi:hypothetical protein
MVGYAAEGGSELTATGPQPAVVDGDPPAVSFRSRVETIGGTIEVEIGDVKIRIGRGADAATLAMVLRALKAGA